MADKPLTWRPRPGTREMLDEAARRKGQSRSAIIDRAVRRYIERDRQREREGDGRTD